MKIKFALSAGLVLLSGLGLAFAGQAKSAAVPAAVTQEDAKVKEFKDILFKLVRQDEYLDEAIESLDSSASRPDAQELAALGVSLKSIAKNLNHVSALNKAEFTSIQSDTKLATYTNTILSYSRKVDRKAGQVGALIAQLAVQNKKAALRDAVTTRKNGKKARGGKKLTQILEEQKAVERLAADAKTLRGASRNLTATSKWLYIASK
ncbi:MAG: hypothetical protein PHV33_00685 [Elusimicrobiales bacterium]|nr:hypothetical protein [Elusimicrobiales bacterium]